MSPRPLVVGAMALVLVAGASACSSGQVQERTNATTTLASTPTTTTIRSALRPGTNVAPATTDVPGGCPSGIGVAAQNAEQAARCLFEAWEEGDRAKAAFFASLDVVDILFRERWSPPKGTFKGCAAEPGTGGQTCTFEHRGARYLFGVRRSEGGWRVTATSR